MKRGARAWLGPGRPSFRKRDAQSKDEESFLGGSRGWGFGCFFAFSSRIFDFHFILGRISAFSTPVVPS